MMTVIQLDGGGEISNAHVAESVGILYPAERVDVILELKASEPDQATHFIIALDNE